MEKKAIHKTPGVILLIILSAWVLNGCVSARAYLADLLEYPYFEVTPTADQLNLTPTPDENPCSYAWGSKYLPEESAEIYEIFKQADMAYVHVQMEAFGVSCVRVRSNSVTEFDALQTDFGFSVEVNTLENRKRMGDIVYDIVVVMEEIDIAALPGNQAGEVNIRFYTDEGYGDVWFPVEEGRIFIDRNLKGERLMDLIYRE